MIRRGKFDFPASEWANVSLEAKDLIVRLLEKDPAKRLDADQALAHPWLAQAMEPLSEAKIHKLPSQNQAQVLISEASNEDAGIDANDGNTASGESTSTTEFGPALSKSPVDPPDPPAPNPVPLKQQATQTGSDSGEYGTAEESPPRGLDTNVVSRLRRFTRTNKLKRAALGVIARYLNRHEIESLKTQFKLIDDDGNGVVTINELAKAMRSVGLNPSMEEVQSILKALDEDKNGKIDYEEFLAASIDRHIYLREELLETAFHYFDVQGTGSISRKDLMTRLSSENSVHDILQEFDANQDEKLSYDEFKAVMLKSDSQNAPSFQEKEEENAN